MCMVFHEAFTDIWYIRFIPYILHFIALNNDILL